MSPISVGLEAEKVKLPKKAKAWIVAWEGDKTFISYRLALLEDDSIETQWRHEDGSWRTSYLNVPLDVVRDMGRWIVAARKEIARLRKYDRDPMGVENLPELYLEDMDEKLEAPHTDSFDAFWED